MNDVPPRHRMLIFCFLLILIPPTSTLFPYTTLFRSCSGAWFDRGPSHGVRPRPPRSPRCCRRSEEHTSELQSHVNLVCRLLLEKKNNTHRILCNMNNVPTRHNMLI